MKTWSQGPKRSTNSSNKFTGWADPFDPEDFFILNGEYQPAGIVEFPSREAAKQVADSYARSGRGRLQLEPSIATGPDGYEDYVSKSVE